MGVGEKMIPEELIGSVSIRLYAGVSGMTARKIAKEIIKDVLSAVLDGELKLPGEELRGKVGFPRVDNMATVYVTMGGDIVFDDGEYLLRPQDGDILIALRKEEEK